MVTVDAWLNDGYLGGFQTGKNGEVTIVINLRKGSNTLKFRLRNSDSTVINSSDFIFDISTYLRYLFFAVFGFFVEELKDFIDDTKDELFIDTTTYLDRFADLVSVWRVYGWSISEFRATIKALIKAFAYNATVKGVNDVLDAFAVVDTIWVWEYLDPWRAIRVGDMVTSTGVINKEDFTYGVSACKYNGEETTPVTLRMDGRWKDSAYITDINIMEWDEVDGADFYKIYRSADSTTTPLGLMDSKVSPIFIDNGVVTPTYTSNPLTLNYSSMSPPLLILGEW